MEKRDPRVDPKRGDELSGSKSRRYVGRIDPDGAIGFTYWPINGPQGIGNDSFTSISTWRKWAKNAEVLHVAD